MSEFTYRQSGVDLDKADQAKNKIAQLAKKTFTPDVLTGIGNFGGTFRSPQGGALVASADGVGTKLMIAQDMGIFDTVGKDLVNHCVNDISVMGAKPLFFLDYIGHSDLEPENIAEIVSGFSDACCQNKMALIGGETAQMPGIYPDKTFDLVGFIVGKTDEDKLLTGERIVAGDVVVAFPSNGLHTNGYSLARKVFEKDDWTDLYDGKSLGAMLLEPHTSYLNEVEWLLENTDVHGMAHITGGGVPGNLVRVLPKNLDGLIKRNSAPRPRIFDLIQERGVDEQEMFRVFNMGFGYLTILSESDAEKVLANLPTSFIAGRIEDGQGLVKLI